MSLIHKIRNTLNTTPKNQDPNQPARTDLNYNERNDCYKVLAQQKQEKSTVQEVNNKIDRINELAAILNKTTVKATFYDSITEIEKLLTELSEYECKMDFSYPPSKHLKDFQNSKNKRIELLEKRIAQNESRTEPKNLSKQLTEYEEKSPIIDSFSTDKQLLKYIYPPISLLKNDGNSEQHSEEIKLRATKLTQTLQAFKVNADIVDITHGPRFTRFEIQINKGVRIKDILRIKDDIKLNLETTSLHIEAPIPGKTTIGIDAANNEPPIVTLREIIESDEFTNFPSDLAIVIGKDIAGNTIIESLDNMCHLLIGGTIGSGKSVCINSIIISLLYKTRPSDVKLILIDTKAINLYQYNSIPHLMIPVITQLEKAPVCLNWIVKEMNDRYEKFAYINVKNLKDYNKAAEEEFRELIQKLPHIIIIIDDFSDLMTIYNNDIKEEICRLAQMGRACGIHLIISTQRPSVDVIPGSIKANIPSRIAFNVFSATDSIIILDEKGAEKLFPDGDMLFRSPNFQKPLRVQGVFVSDSEISDVVDFLKNQMLGSMHAPDIERKIKSILSSSKPGDSSTKINNDVDLYFAEAGRFVIEKKQASIGMLQREFKIGFNRATHIIDQLGEAGVIGAEEGTKPRRILMNIEQFETYINNYLVD